MILIKRVLQKALKGRHNKQPLVYVALSGLED